MPSVSSDLSMRLSRPSKARMRTSGIIRATSRARICGHLIDIGERIGKFRRCLANHRDGNVAKSWLLREHGEKRLDHARRKAIANDDAIDVAAH